MEWKTLKTEDQHCRIQKSLRWIELVLKLKPNARPALSCNNDSIHTKSSESYIGKFILMHMSMKICMTRPAERQQNSHNCLLKQSFHSCTFCRRSEDSFVCRVRRAIHLHCTCIQQTNIHVNSFHDTALGLCN